jgi:hypothetical protein
MTHHAGRIDLVFEVHDLGRRGAVFVAAMPLGFAVAPFAADARLLMGASKIFFGETVVTCTAKCVRDENALLALVSRVMENPLLK